MSQETKPGELLRRELSSFIGGADRSREAAARIEAVIGEHFVDDPRFEDLAYALALYLPGGGDYMVDGDGLAAECRLALEALDAGEDYQPHG